MSRFAPLSLFRFVSLSDGGDGFLPSLLQCVVCVVKEHELSCDVIVVDNSRSTALYPPNHGGNYSMPKGYLTDGAGVVVEHGPLAGIDDPVAFVARAKAWSVTLARYANSNSLAAGMRALESNEIARLAAEWKPDDKA